MSRALIAEFYDALPEPRGDNPKAWEARLRTALDRFKRDVSARYSEGTLLRLLCSSDGRTRRGALVALGLLGSMKSCNAAIAVLLHDDERIIRQLAADALWAIWFRGADEVSVKELNRIAHLRDRRKKRVGLDALIAKAPEFAEAYNQRAILHFENEEWYKSIADCEHAIELNPFQFGAAAGMGRCYMEVGKQRAALKAFRNALRINPSLDDVEQAIRALESTLGEEGRRDDKR